VKRIYLVCCLLCFALSAAGSVPIDTFYTMRYDAGIAALKNEAWSTAWEELRVARFGFLSHPAWRAKAGMAMVVAAFHLKEMEELDALMTQLKTGRYQQYQDQLEEPLKTEFINIVEAYNQHRAALPPDKGKAPARTVRNDQEVPMDVQRDRVKMLYEQEKYEQVDKVLRGYPDADKVPELLLYWGAAAYMTGDTKASINRLRTYAGLVKQPRDLYYYIQSLLFIEQENWPQAHKLLLAIKKTKDFPRFAQLMAQVRDNLPEKENPETASTPTEPQPTEPTPAIETPEPNRNGQFKRVEALYKDKQYDDILTLYQRSSGQITDPNARYLISLAMFSKRRYQEAADILEELKKQTLMDTYRAHLPFYLGACYLRLQETAKGCAELKALYLSPGPLSTERRITLVNYLLNASCLDEETISTLAKQQPNSAMYVFAQAMSAYSRRDFTTALDALKRVKTMVPENYYVNFYQGLIYFSTQRYVNALLSFEYLFALGFHNDHLLYYLGATYFYTGKYRECVDTYTGIQKHFADDDTFQRILREAKKRLKP